MFVWKTEKKNIFKIANGAPNLKTTRQLFSTPNMAGPLLELASNFNN
jgi:hypothetical protein